MIIGMTTTKIDTTSDMVIAGGILPTYLSSQEGDIGVTAVVIKSFTETICLITCDNLMMDRAFLDKVTGELERDTGIPFANILISATHTHHAPSMMKIHGYGPDIRVMKEFGNAIKTAVKGALENCVEGSLLFDFFDLPSVGHNSRRLLEDDKILWVPQLEDYLRYPATGPVDPELSLCCLLGFNSKRAGVEIQGIWFNHSCHNIGNLNPAQSPGFYGLAAQQLVSDFKCPVGFFSGASGSTHDFSRDTAGLIKKVRDPIYERVTNIEDHDYISIDNPVIYTSKEEFTYEIREFDEQEEDDAVKDYCMRMDISDCGEIEDVVNVFRDMRRELASQRGVLRKTWLHVIVIGSVAIVGLPGEVFTCLGLEIKRKSPFKRTIIIQLANDAIGYISDEKGHHLGGYQLWAGYHSLLPVGTGERLVRRVIALLSEIKKY